MRHWLRLWVGWLWGLGFLPLGWAQGGEVVDVLRTAERGGHTVSSQTVALPDRLPRELQAEAVRVAYRWRLEADPDARGERALWVFRVGAPYRLRINGQPARALLPEPQAPAAADAVFNGRGPVLFALPEGAVDVELAFAAPPFMPHGLVRAVHGPVGPLAVMHVAARADMAGPVAVMVVLGGALGLVGGLLWWFRGRYPLLGLLAVLYLVLALRYQVIYLSVQVGASPLAFEHLNTLAVVASALLCAAAVWSLTGQLRPARQRLLVGIGTAFVLVSVPALVYGQGLLMLRAAGYGLMLVALVALPVHILRQRQRLKPAWTAVLSAGHLALGLGAVHDLGFVLNYTPVSHGTMVVWGWAGLVLAYALVSADHVLDALRRSQAAELELEHRVSEARAELQRSYAALAEYEKQQAARSERQLIMRELHDSLGAQLVTALRGVQRDALDKTAVIHALEDSLSDLRELLSIRHHDGHLVSALANWRHHWGARLARAGVVIEWAMDERLENVALSPDVLHQLLRIVQECATNTLKHSHAQRFRVEASLGAEGIGLRLCDDGQGFGAAPTSGTGHGLSGMQSRAEHIGAELRIGHGPAPWGACVTVVLPVPAKPSGAIA